ncbi:MAG: PAS domain S-box protein [Bacteroidetes bacterium]|nr:PAS domain S-box protein [Bacteroidota bacterium]
MFPTKKEAGHLTNQFLTSAARYFTATENWQNDIRHLLAKLTLITGSSRVSLQQWQSKSNSEHQVFELTRTWCRSSDLDNEGLYVVCRGKAKVELLKLLCSGQQIHLLSSEAKAGWNVELNEFGIESYSGFPILVNEKLWGVLGFEFTLGSKTWDSSELSILSAFTALLGSIIENEQTSPADHLNNSYFEELFHSSPAAIVVLDQNGIVESVNREFTRLFQYEQAEIKGRKIDEFLPSDFDKESAVQLTDRILEGERIAHEGVRYRKDGSPVFVTIVGTQSQPDHKQPRVYSIYYDITDKVIAQEKLKESQARFELLFESANDAIFLLKEGIVFECNARTLEMFKCTREEIIGRTAIDLSPQRQPNGIPSLKLAVKYNKAAQGHAQQSFEWMHQRLDGSQFMAEVSINVFEWKGESFAQAIVRDITRRKKTETLLRQRFEFITFLSRVSADLINLESDKIDESINELLAYSGSFSGSNRAFVYLINHEAIQLHLSYKWIADTSVSAFVLDQILISDLPGVYQKLVKGETVIKAVPLMNTRSEEALLAEILDLSNIVSYVITPLTVSGKFMGMIAYFADKEFEEWNDEAVNPLKLTSQMIANAIERSRVEHELKNAKEKAVESDKLKTAFLSSMSHEIRTPMNHILGFIELLKDPGLTEKEKKEFMTIVKSSGNLLLKLIDDIIDIAKLESGQLLINQVDLDLDKFMDDLYISFSDQLRSIGKGRIEFKILKPERLATKTIKTDPLRLQQIVSNLLSNALKFTLEGKITFGYTLYSDNKLHFFVEDTGIGIPEEKHLEVFERFRQLDSSYAREYSGTGLGLAISKGLVELMQGEIGLDSEPGMGSRFFFTIPFTPVKHKTEDTGLKSLATNEYNFSGKTVLVVEDDEINFRFLEIVIHKTKAKVIRALTGREAIDISLGQAIDLVLMDIQIPLIDGYIATAEIKKVKPDLRIVAQTAHALAEEKTKCLESGADDYLSKPINRRDLLSKMSLFLGEKKNS